MSAQDDKQFAEWYESFVTTYPGPRVKNPIGWASKVDETHKDIRKILGGVNKTYEIETSEVTIPINDQRARWYYDVFGVYIRGFFDDFPEITAESFKQPEITIHGKSKPRKTRLNRVIQTYLDNLNDAAYYKESAKTQLANLITEWGRNKSKATKCYATIATSPKAFSLVGSLGCDSDSCWQQGVGSNQDRKWTWAVQPNTFVLCFKQDNDGNELEQESKNNLGRMLGWIHNDRVFNAFNHYHHAGLSDGTLQLALTGLATSVLGLKEPFVNTRPLSISGAGLYGNHSYHSIYSGADKLVSSDAFMMRGVPYEEVVDIIDGDEDFYDDDYDDGDDDI